MIRRSLAALAATALLLAGCSRQHTKSDEIPLTPISEQLGWKVVPLSQIKDARVTGDYRIKTGDALDISVYDQPELKRTMPVRPDGKISFPLIHDLKAEGETVDDLRGKIRHLLTKYVKNPQVTVILKQFAGTRVTVVGDVNNPGIVVIDRNARLSDALAKAGWTRAPISDSGFGIQGSDLRRAYLIRDGKVLGVDFYRLMEAGDMTQNIVLADGDLIHIPSSIDNQVYIIGEVVSPRTVRFRNQIDLVYAIAEAGGLKENVTTGTVVLIRGGLKNPKSYKIDIKEILHAKRRNVQLQRDDIVYVSPSSFDSVVDVAGKITTILQGVISGGSSTRAFNGKPKFFKD